MSIIIPEEVRRFNYGAPGVFDHPTCKESEPKYKILLTTGTRTPCNDIVSPSGVVIGRLKPQIDVFDTLRLESNKTFLPVGIIKNPLFFNSHHPEQIGANSGLIATRNWLYIGRIRDGVVEIIRPVRDNYYPSLRHYFDLFTNKH